MVDYPTNYPLPDYGSYSGTISQGLARTEVPSMRPNQNQTFNSPRTDISMTFTMKNDFLLTWLLWIRNNGYSWFRMPVISGYPPDEITEIRTVRVTSETNNVKQGDNWSSVTLAIELVPGEP
jgi:hypothetical protein